MLAILRFLQILHAVVRFRLDTLIDRKRLPWWARILSTPLALLPAPKASRGERLRRFLEHMGPVFVKFGQLLSTRPDLVPYDLIVELNQLQDNVTPFPSDQFTRLVETALGQSVDTLFHSFEHEPLASASVAQVHCAVLKDGQAVVVKAIRPGLEPTISKDIALLKVIASLGESLTADGKRMHLPDVVEDYRNTIFDELNLLREAANASQLRRNFEHSPLLYVPRVYWDYCRPNIMVMERIYGIPVTDIDQLNEQNTNMQELAERGVEIFFKQVFEHNFFHADMHPGNIFVAREHPQTPKYIAVDMAVVGSLSREDQYYLARNILAMFRRDYRQVAELHVYSGWVDEDTSVAELEAAVRSVCEPIFEKPLGEISFGQVLITLFATARRFNMEVQPQLVLLQKTLLNIEGLGRQLYPQLDLWQTAHPYMEKWLKDRFNPRTLIKELQRYGPEWLEKFPEVPNLVFANLDRFAELAKLTPDIQQLVIRQQQASNTKRAKLKRLWLPLAAAAGISAWPEAQAWFAAQPVITLILAGIALTAWWWLA